MAGGCFDAGSPKSSARFGIDRRFFEPCGIRLKVCDMASETLPVGDAGAEATRAPRVHSQRIGLPRDALFAS